MDFIMGQLMSDHLFESGILAMQKVCAPRASYFSEEDDEYSDDGDRFDQQPYRSNCRTFGDDERAQEMLEFEDMLLEDVETDLRQSADAYGTYPSGEYGRSADDTMCGEVTYWEYVAMQDVCDMKERCSATLSALVDLEVHGSLQAPGRDADHSTALTAQEIELSAMDGRRSYGDSPREDHRSDHRRDRRRDRDSDAGQRSLAKLRRSVRDHGADIDYFAMMDEYRPEYTPDYYEGRRSTIQERSTNHAHWRDVRRATTRRRSSREPRAVPVPQQMGRQARPNKFESCD